MPNRPVGHADGRDDARKVTGETSKLQSCASVQRNGRRIVSNLGILEFVVPHSAYLKRVQDIDYEEYFVRYGNKRAKLWMNLMFGGTVGGFKPRELANPAIEWTSQKWGCHNDEDGTEWRGVGTSGQRWRHISIPFGSAGYEGVPPNAADYFDKILDSMCCGKRPTCKK